ncbi:MAG: hypothetical protein IH623_25210 [Verrucomicrobia bacterium]|nr:hypothetical protein [Verrucomicrobiota bacterium]
MKLKHIAAILVAVSVVGCASVDVTKTAKGYHDKTDPNEVEILKTRPERSYEELGTVTATGFVPAETAKMHNAIRTKSAALGANAVILTEEGIIPGGWGGGKKWATGVAVRYK